MGPRSCAGFSLIEVLVSVLVLAIGVMGTGAMQLTAVRTAQQSSLHSAAVHFAAELADRMRANDEQMHLDDPHNPFLGLDISGAGEPSPAPDADCYKVACDAAQLARFELYDWAQRLRGALPGVRAVVCRDSEPWDATIHRLAWDCATDDSASIVIKIGWAVKDPSGRMAADLDGGAFPEIALLVSPYAP